MNILKELPSISWLVDEPTYRGDLALSYSTLSTYESLGFNGLDHLFDRKETPSLTLGSCVDSIITGGFEEFNERFSVLNINITEGGINTVKQLIAMHLPFNSFEEIPEQVVSQAAKEVGFWKADKWDKKRYSAVLETGNVAEYYNCLLHTDKTIIDTDTYSEVVACVQALKESPATCGYFADNDELSPIRRYYQLKFKATFENVHYRCMADELLVDYEKKIVYPIDLKTSSHTEWDFQQSFCQWRYMIQARLYWRIIRANMLKDEYFKDFELMPYRFIVVNKKTLTPLVWEFPLTMEIGTLVDEEGNEYRDPFEIGKELQAYLNCKPPVPNGINIDGINIIQCLKKK